MEIVITQSETIGAEFQNHQEKKNTIDQPTENYVYSPTIKIKH